MNSLQVQKKVNSGVMSTYITIFETNLCNSVAGNVYLFRILFFISRSFYITLPRKINRLTQKREIKVTQNTKFSQNREIKCREIRNLKIAKPTCRESFM